MKKIIKNLSICFGFMMLLFCGVVLSSCCSPKPLEVTVTFKGADSRLGLSDYKYLVEFNDSTKVSFDVPKGYDHTQISGSISDVNVDYNVKFKDEKSLEKGYEYASEKTITFEIDFVKRDFELVVDLSKMTKLTFDISLAGDMTDFQAIIIPQEMTDGFLTDIWARDVIETVDIVNYKVSIEYGNYVVLSHNKQKSGVNYDALYSYVNHYTLDKNKASIGSINYSYYNRAKKGNSDYTYNGDSRTALYYIGEIKEDIDIRSSIPNYEPDKGFQIERNYNTFYMFTNLEECNSDLFSIEAYAPTSDTYDSSSADMDIIDGQVVKKVKASDTFNFKYDIHKIYLGNDLQNDALLNDEDRETIHEKLYFVVSSAVGQEYSSSVDIWNNITFHMLENQYELCDDDNKINLASDNNGYKETAKGKKYIQFSDEDLDKFSLTRDYLVGDSKGEYETGLCILYPKLTYNFFSAHKQNDYLTIYKNISIDDSSLSSDDFYYNIYILEDGKKNYGMVDNHFWLDSETKMDRVYFRKTDLLELGEDGVYRYKGNLYVDFWCKGYENYKSIVIEQLHISVDGNSQTGNGLKLTTDGSSTNGIKGFKIETLYFRDLGEYTLTVQAVMKQAYQELTTLDFSYFEMPSNYTNGVYITNNPLFESIEDFFFVNENNKTTFNQMKFSMYGDLYYFVRSDEDFDIEVRLQADDPTTKISTSQDFCDIKGDKITMNIQGFPYKIKVIKQDTIYELLESGKMYVVKA